MHGCATCTATIDQGSICVSCAKGLHDQLHKLAGLLYELDTQLARQSRTGDGSGPRSAVKPLPYDVRASVLEHQVRAMLVGWCRDICATHGDWPADNAAAMLARLSRHDWRNHHAADEFALDIAGATNAIIGAIDTAVDRVYLGTCGLGLPDSCTRHLYAERGDAVCSCPDCGEVITVSTRRTILVGLCSDQLAHAELIARALTSLAVEVSGDTIRQWAHRGRILAKGHDRAGRPVYRVGDCRELAQGIARRAR